MTAIRSTQDVAKILEALRNAVNANADNLIALQDDCEKAGFWGSAADIGRIAADVLCCSDALRSIKYQYFRK